MTPTHYSAVRGSTGPSLTDTLQQSSGAADLTGATVVLRLQHASTGEVVEFSMVVDADPSTGIVYRDWAVGELDIREGVWWGQYRVQIGAAVEIWPTCESGDEIESQFGWHGLRFVICPAIPAP